MTKTFAPDSVGLVTPFTVQFDEPLDLACGRTLSNYELVVETYGTLNANKSNAILICHALSGNHHAAGFHSEDDRKPGWWDGYIGPGKAIDTNKFFIVSLNNLGGCSGSTGPRSINPDTGKPWGADFPKLRVRDWVHSQARLADSLGINQWAAVIGGSLGGMQAMRWALEYPSRVRNCVVIASAMKLSAQNIAFNETARQAIISDPEFHNGNYLDHNTYPKNGLAIARMIGHITYLSDDVMGEKFGRDLRSGSFDQGLDELVEFQVESYLRYQGDSFSKNFDANTYILMTRALDYFDLAREYGDDAAAAFRRAQCDFYVASFTTDWRFPIERSREIVDALISAQKNVSYTEVESPYGHDAFLLPNEHYCESFSRYLAGIDTE
ncbi:homoserine O-acetyltransferase [Gilvimarinus sp. SDUM040013]|uniref:Homoserine O-succinyltransferase n=1 Tax=Gilvimarinus gilvus TaxID=3058038 RepID=A0ABU4RYZ8_9GAMM|nr:homoserine O-acetyltransferase [Gilvimarinus sp. SDUM040013]MDO3387600.1 homoserine O-acetyltransferase [Gilvimarinus sp. SDUM040013]MDX6850135.1 homoserine O-acetyltransferase [Gilvimarinus sp. SDUM040013]